MLAALVKSVFSDTDFNKEMEDNAKFIQSCFEKPTTGFMPMLVLYTNRNKRLVFAIEDIGETSEERHKLLYDLMHQFGLKGSKEHGYVIAMFFMSEAWVRGQTYKGEKIPLPISQSPMKSEIVLSSGMTLDGRTNMLTIPMLRGEHRVVVLDLKHMQKTPYDPKTKDKLESFMLQAAFQGYVNGMVESKDI